MARDDAGVGLTRALGGARLCLPRAMSESPTADPTAESAPADAGARAGLLVVWRDPREIAHAVE